VSGHSLAISAVRQAAVSDGPVIDTQRSFTVSAWLRAAYGGQSAAAVSEVGPVGSSFSLGIDTEAQGPQSLYGEVGRRSTLSAGIGTWWTFEAPASDSCPAASCGVRANSRYDDGRDAPRIEGWHQVTGVYDARTQTISVYVDGIAEDVEHVDAVPPGGALIVGAGFSDYPGADTFIGAIDELRTYGRALTPAEVGQLYQATRP
jgi:hypothetical protein